MSLVEKVATVSNNIPMVYAAGREVERDKFWESFQRGGNKQSYTGAFEGWSGHALYPKYDLRPTNADSMFRDMNTASVDSAYDDKEFNLAQRLKECGVVLDMSNCTSASYLFHCSVMGEIPEMDFRNLTNLVCTFRLCRAKTISKIILKSDGTQNFDTVFLNNKWLENVAFEGVIGRNLDIQWSTLLTQKSLRSIINALSETATEVALTLSLTAVNNAFETTEGAGDGSTSEEWLALVATKTNWTISLV